MIDTAQLKAAVRPRTEKQLAALRGNGKKKAHTLESIVARSIPVPESGCWLWLGGGTANGYGRVSYHGKIVSAHRIVYELSVRPIPQGMQTDHLCRVRCCINPSHIEIVTPRENTLRGFGPTAINARRTHCMHGHKLTGYNLTVLGDGERHCKACARIYYHEHVKNKVRNED